MEPQLVPADQVVAEAPFKLFCRPPKQTPEQLHKNKLAQDAEYRRKVRLGIRWKRRRIEVDAVDPKACTRCAEVKDLDRFKKMHQANGDIVRSRTCYDCYNKNRRIARATIPALMIKNRATCRARYQRNKSDPAAWCRKSIHGARGRARAQKVPFDLTANDIIAAMPEDLCCPALGVPFVFGGRNPYNPSLDKIVPGLGYVRGNIAIISIRANFIKQDANAFEVSQVAQWLEREELYRGIISLDLSEVVWKKNRHDLRGTKDAVVTSGA